jgi:predicted ABC-type ATPase
LPRLYIIAGCNGAGKTTASYTILPELLNCREFVNADEIAKGLSPFQPETVAFEAGRIMLERIDHLMQSGADFAFETTLSARTYVDLIKRCREKGYEINLLFFWLNSPELAKERVAYRVSAGGHNIPDDVVERRYERGLKNLFKLYMPISDFWLLIDNSEEVPVKVATKINGEVVIHNDEVWKEIYNLGL